MPGTCHVDQRDTHRLIPAHFTEGGASVLARLADHDELLAAIFELDSITNDRLIAESGRHPGIDQRELVFGIPSYRIINAAFSHPQPTGSRFNSADRGAWYAAFELETAQAEVAYHRLLWLREIEWTEVEACEYVDYLADFNAEFHDLRSSPEHADCLAPDSYVASQSLAARLLHLGSAGIVYLSARRPSGVCLVCFRPVLVTNVRKANVFEFVFQDLHTPPTIRPA